MKSDLRTHEVRQGQRMVEKDEAVQLAKDLSQYIIYSDLLSQHFITEAVGYYECSSLEATGLNDIVQAVVLASVNHSNKLTRRTFTRPWKRYHMSSCDQHVILLYYVLYKEKQQ